LFVEACTELAQYKRFTSHFPDIPILANMTEFGKTPIYSVAEFNSIGISMVLYPLSAHRAMSKSALDTYNSILTNGHQLDMLPAMQTRSESYAILNYDHYERQQQSVTY
jgi:methylisocitrate lyase